MKVEKYKLKLLYKLQKIKYGKNLKLKGIPFIYNRKGARLEIGDNTCIGGNTKILDNDFHPNEYEKRNALLQGTAPEGDDSRADWIGTKEIVIGKNCFIGCNALILKGTVLGDGCVVGAGAVVAGTFPPGSVIVGNPARVIRTLG